MFLVFTLFVMDIRFDCVFWSFCVLLVNKMCMQLMKWQLGNEGVNLVREQARPSKQVRGLIPSTSAEHARGQCGRERSTGNGEGWTLEIVYRVHRVVTLGAVNQTG